MVNTKMTLAALSISFLLGQACKAQEPKEPLNNSLGDGHQSQQLIVSTL